MTPINVMIVEDEKVVALHLRQQLAALGYKVSSIASSAQETMTKIALHRPDVVLMDIKIQGDKDGIETAQAIRENLDVPIIYLTAYSEQSVLDRAAATKPYGYLLKPFSERELHATIIIAIRRHETETALRASEQRLELALDVGDMGCWEMEPASRQVVGVNRADRLLGINLNAFSGDWNEFMAGVVEHDRSHVDEQLGSAALCDGAAQVEFRRRNDGGEIRWLRARAKMFSQADETQAGRVVGILQDITKEQSDNIRLRNAATVFNATQDGLVILDKDLRILDANPPYVAMTRTQRETLIGEKPFFAPALSAQHDPAFPIDPLPGGRHWRIEVSFRRPNGEDGVASLAVASILDDRGRLAHHVAIISDLTDMRRAEAELRRIAHYDTLTGLPNRFLALDRLSGTVRRARRNNGRMAVLFADLDNFKQINDTLGHDCGDLLLAETARRMASVVRGEDTVARLGGDEFMIILEQITGPDTPALVVRRLQAQFAAPFRICDHLLTVSLSIGISCFPSDGEEGGELLKAADTAMYVAKESGKNNYSFYNKNMTIETLGRMTQEQEIRRAVKNNELVIFYQPVFSLDCNEICGFEALLRWRHPQHGLRGADWVIPVAERDDLILEIGDWVLRQACGQLADWRRRGLNPDVRMAVNISIRQFRRGDLCASITQALSDADLPPELLEIEVTESMLQSATDAEAMLGLSRLGVSLTLDDFGTGYSCLGSLKTLPVGRLKIDRSFVAGIPDDPRDMALTEAIIAMAHRLGLKVTAEGVETRTQLEFIRRLQCEDAQGYLMARPQPAEDIERLLQIKPA